MSNNKKEKIFNKLIKKISRGDEASLESLDALYGKLIYTTALVKTKSSFLADEVVDDVLMKIIKLSPNLSKIKNPEGWLYTLTANCSKDRKKENEQYLEIYNIPYNNTELDSILDKDEFYKSIEFLNDFEQQILIFRFIENMSFDEIAKAIDKPLSTITSAYYRALEKIKEKNK